MSFLGRLNYTSLVGSEVHGVQSIKMEAHEFMQYGESFSMTLKTRVIRKIETDSLGRSTDMGPQMTLRKIPPIVTHPDDRPQGRLGVIYIQKEQTEEKVNIHHQSASVGFGYVGGFFFLFNGLAFLLIKGCINAQFSSSLRNEVAPITVLESDRKMSSSWVDSFKRSYLSGTCW